MDDIAAIDHFNAIIHRKVAENPSLTRLEAVRLAAIQNPKAHRAYILATNPNHRRQAQELLNAKAAARRHIWRTDDE